MILFKKFIVLTIFSILTLNAEANRGGIPSKSRRSTARQVRSYIGLLAGLAIAAVGVVVVKHSCSAKPKQIDEQKEEG